MVSSRSVFGRVSGLALPCTLCLLTGRGFSCLADTKYMNANDNIDGAASWLMCSVGTAKRLGIPEEKWVYQHSGAHCHEGTEQVRSAPPPRNALQPGRDHTRTCSLPHSDTAPLML